MTCTTATEATHTAGTHTAGTEVSANDTGADATSITTDDTATTQNAEGIELVAGLRSEELERRLLQAHRETEVGHRQLAFYLHEMQARGVHQRLGYCSAVH